MKNHKQEVQRPIHATIWDCHGFFESPKRESRIFVDHGARGTFYLRIGATSMRIGIVATSSRPQIAATVTFEM